MEDRNAGQFDRERFEELAALAALGLLNEAEAQQLAGAFAAYREADGAVVESLRDAAASIAFELAPVTPRASVADKLFSTIAREEAIRPAVEVRLGEGKWRDIGVPGVDVKMLYRDKTAKTNTMLVRLQPGATYPTHQHLDNEQCLILEGEMRLESLSYRPGDFIVSVEGSVHSPITAPNGALLLIIAGRSEFIEE